MKKYLLFILILGHILTNPSLLIAQSLQIQKVDPTAYPIIKVHFTATNTKGDRLVGTDIPANGVSASENGIVRHGTVECPSIETAKFSVLLVIDITGSMMDKVDGSKTKMDIVKEVANHWIASLPNGRFECCLMSFHSHSYVLVGFTDDKTILNMALYSDTLRSVAKTTDLNSALLYDVRTPPQPGALRVAERAKYPPYIIFLTDGGHDNKTRPHVFKKEIREKAAQLGAKIYTITMTDQSELVPSQVEDVNAISDKVYWNKKNEAEVSAVINEIMNEIRSSIPPCIFTFETDCHGGNELALSIDNSFVQASDTVNYTIPSGEKPVLEFASGFGQPFLNIGPGMKLSHYLYLYARQKPVTFSGSPEISLPGFKILSPKDWSGLTINKDDSLEIMVEYTGAPGDSTCRESAIRFKSTDCIDNVAKVYSGWIFAHPVEFGIWETGKEHTLKCNAVFCNNSCFPVTVEKTDFEGGDCTYFKVKTRPLPYELAPGECLDMELKFNPRRDKNYQTTLSVFAGGKLYRSIVTGVGEKSLHVKDKFVDRLKAGIMLHPNPCSIIIQVNITLTDAGDMNISILNYDGRTFLKETVDNVASFNKLYDISFLPIGYYVFQVEVNGNVFEKAFLKNK